VVVDGDLSILAFCKPFAVFNDCAAGSKIPPRLLFHPLDHRLDLPNFERIIRREFSSEFQRGNEFLFGCVALSSLYSRDCKNFANIYIYIFFLLAQLVR
jgi:hypothetical protein